MKVQTHTRADTARINTFEECQVSWGEGKGQGS